MARARAQVLWNFSCSTESGARARIRTGGLPLRRRMLYPTELHARAGSIDLYHDSSASTLRLFAAVGVSHLHSSISVSHA